MKLLFACNRRFLPGLEITIASVLASTRWNGRIEVCVAGDDFDAEQWAGVSHRLLAFDPRLDLRLLDPGLELWGGLLSRSAPGWRFYAWLSALQKNFTDDRVLVLDADLLIARDVFELQTLDLGGLPVAACPDVRKHLACDCPDPDLAATHGLATYFNSGVVLVDAEAWRRERLFDRAATFVHRWPGQIRDWDQTVLNCILPGRIHTLPWMWNVSHEHAGWVDSSQPPMEKIDGTVLHLWKQWKPWLGLNFAWSGAMWYGLAKAYAAVPAMDYHRVPNSRTLCWRRRHPRLTAWSHHLRGQPEIAAFWRERHRELPGRRWARDFPRAIENCHRWWKKKLAQRPQSSGGASASTA